MGRYVCVLDWYQNQRLGTTLNARYTRFHKTQRQVKLYEDRSVLSGVSNHSFKTVAVRYHATSFFVEFGHIVANLLPSRSRIFDGILKILCCPVSTNQTARHRKLFMQWLSDSTGNIDHI